MRRAEHEITDPDEVAGLLSQAHVLYLAMVDEGQPYVLPLSYGYDGRDLYVHSASAGRKIEVLRRNPRVGFAVKIEEELTRGEISCRWSVKYRSLVGEGVAHFVDDESQKRYGLDVLMKQHGGAGGDYEEGAVAKTTVLRIEITSLSGKQSGFDG